jgi:hypothetical protein
VANYTITLKTGDKALAGTDGDIYLILAGEEATSDEITLPTEQELFERGSEDSFPIETSEPGNLKEITLRLDLRGKDPAWYLERITIVNEDTGEKWEAQVNSWFKKAYRGGADSTTQTISLQKVAGIDTK